jgi:hypothetical protein
LHPCATLPLTLPTLRVEPSSPASGEGVLRVLDPRDAA